MEFLARLTDFIWSPWLLGLFLLTGLVYSLGSGFFQIFGFRLWLRSTLGSLFHGRKKAGGGLSSLQALATALASTMGTGSIAGGGHRPDPGRAWGRFLDVDLSPAGYDDRLW